MWLLRGHSAAVLIAVSTDGEAFDFGFCCVDRGSPVWPRPRPNVSRRDRSAASFCPDPFVIGHCSYWDLFNQRSSVMARLFASSRLSDTDSSFVVSQQVRPSSWFLMVSCGILYVWVVQVCSGCILQSYLSRIVSSFRVSQKYSPAFQNFWVIFSFGSSVY